MWFFDRSGLFSVVQSGFRKNRCTTDHVVALENTIRSSLINKVCACCHTKRRMACFEEADAIRGYKW